MKMEGKPKPKRQDFPILTGAELHRMLKRFSEGDLQALRRSILDKRETDEKLNALESACQEMDNEEARAGRRDWKKGF